MRVCPQPSTGAQMKALAARIIHSLPAVSVISVQSVVTFDFFGGAETTDNADDTDRPNDKAECRLSDESLPGAEHRRTNEGFGRPDHSSLGAVSVISVQSS